MKVMIDNVQTLPTSTDAWRWTRGEYLRNSPAPGEPFSNPLVIVFDKDIWIDIWKNIWRALDEPQVILFQKHWTLHLDILIVFRKENKGPYVPNRDIMKLFTNTPEARYLRNLSQLISYSYSNSWIIQSHSYHQRCNTDEVELYFEGFTMKQWNPSYPFHSSVFTTWHIYRNWHFVSRKKSTHWNVLS